jgi:hypothetical protein
VRFLRAEGCGLESKVFRLAAARGHTDMCAYLRAEHCPSGWSARLCDEPALNGHASTLRWLHEHGCRMDDKLIHLM